MARHLVERQPVYRGKKVSLELHHFEDDAGHRSKFEVVVHNGAVVILPFLPDGKVALIRNRRHAVGETLLELPAGTLEKGEDPMNCAGRELQEEIGYVAGRLKPIGRFYSSPGILTERMYAFAAYDLVKTATALEEGEEIELHPAELSEAIEWIGSGKIVDGKTITALLIFERFHLHNRSGS